MNTKAIALGVVATVLGFGIGIGIPLASNAKYEITSYEQAQAIMNGASADELAKLETSAAEKAEVTSVDEDKSDNTDITENVSADNKASSDIADNAGGEGIADRGIDIDDKTVVLDWDYLDWAIGGVKMTDSDYDAVLKNLGLSPITVEYTDSGFILDYEGKEYNGKIAEVFYTYNDDDNTVKKVFFDGENYVNDSLDTIPSDKVISKRFAIRDDINDRNNWNNYWNINYTVHYPSGNGYYDSLSINHLEGGITAEDSEAISAYAKLPFMGGTYDDFKSTVKLDEMLDKGLKDESSTNENTKVYIVKTNLGKCKLVIYDYEQKRTSFDENGEQKVESVPTTNYSLNFEDRKYQMDASYAKGSDQAYYVGYRYVY